MVVENKPDHEIDNASCKAHTGRTLDEWYAALDAFQALAKGRRESINHVYAAIGGTDPWWPTTIAVEYERAKGQVKKDGLPEGYTICCTKTIGAPVEKTYSVWTSSNGFAEMMGDGATQDLSEGGSLTCKGGSKGSFSRIRPNKDLRFSWEHAGSTAPVTVDVQFQDNKGKTLMNVMTSRIQTRAEADGLRNAWAAALNRLKQLSEA